MEDPYNLQRFCDAQKPIRNDVTRELNAGQKTTHWMWFVFPQIAGLGKSSTAEFYALSSVQEARAYVAHAELGPQLHNWTRILLRHHNLSAKEIFGRTDGLKFHFSMTLFARTAGHGSVFDQALDKYFDGTPCQRTQELCLCL